MQTQDAVHAPDASAPVGDQIRQWRSLRRLSQMQLALEVGISPRHLSFVETGRARPGAEVLLAIAEALALPLRMRNFWLLAAGYAPRYSEQPLESAALSRVREPLQRLLDAHHPYPGVVVDRHWNLLLANAAAQRLVALLPPFLREPRVNMFRASLHPEGFAAMTKNLPEWGRYLVTQLGRIRLNDPDPALAALDEEIRSWANVQALLAVPAPLPLANQVLLPCVMTFGGHDLSLFTTMTRFGTPLDVTLDELSIELFYPADAAAEAMLRAMG